MVQKAGRIAGSVKAENTTRSYVCMPLAVIQFVSYRFGFFLELFNLPQLVGDVLIFGPVRRSELARSLSVALGAEV